MNWTMLFTSKRQRALREVTTQASLGNWAEVLRLTEAALYPAPASAGTIDKLYKDLLVLHCRAREQIWKTSGLDQAAVPDEATRHDLLFSVLKAEMDRYGASPGWVFFLGHQVGNEPVIDVPPFILSRFAPLPVTVRPITKAKKLGAGGVEDVETRKRGTIFVLQVFGWIDSATAKIGIDSFTGGLAAYGYYAVVHNKDGQWSIREKDSEWMS